MKPLNWFRRFWRDLTDNPMHDPRPEDAAPEADPWAVRDAEIADLRGQVEALTQEVRQLAASPGRATEALPADESEHPLDDPRLTPRRLIPHTTTMVPAIEPMEEVIHSIGTREPGKREKAPTWDNQVRTEVRRRRRATDWQPAKATPLGPTRGDPCFRATRTRMDGSRKSGRLMYVKTDRFDRATQAAREIADGQE